MKNKISSRKGLTAANFSLEAVYKKNAYPSKYDFLI